MNETSSERLSLTAGKIRLILAGGALLWVLAIFLWLQGGIDRAIQIAHEPLRQIPFLMDTALAVSRYGMTACVLVYLVLLVRSLSPGGPKDLQKVFLPIVLSFALAGAAGDLSKPAFDRPRPFVEHPSELSAVISPASSSLPSGHATKSFALVLPFAIFARKGLKKRRALRWGLAAAAAAIAYTRVLMGVHYLGDVLAGAGTALLLLPLVAMAANELYRRKRVEGARMERLAHVCGLILAGMIFYLVRYS
jgi:membrane-associated phospholipid phosphatase